MSIYFIPDVLDPELLAALQGDLASAEFVDGKRSAAGQAAAVKNNLQLIPKDCVEQSQAVSDALINNELFRSISLVRKVRQPQFARYLEGMGYGEHIDAALMTGQTTLRSDLSVTIFLSNDYEGGELLIRTPIGQQSVKLPAGHAVVYPSDTLHSVAPVISGERLVAVAWVQSHIRDTQLRRIIVELGQGAKLLKKRADESEEDSELLAALLLVAKSRDNLLRRFAEF